MNQNTSDEFIDKVYKPKGFTFPIIDLYEAMLQFNGCVAIDVEDETYTICSHSQEVVKECSPEMNDFINCFAQGVMV